MIKGGYMKSLESKILEYEKRPIQTYSQMLGLSDEAMDRFGYYLYHGVRFDDRNRLESIFQMRKIVCGSRIPTGYQSYDGSWKNLWIDCLSEENCNMGEYISVMPYCRGLEFDTFIREHLFFVLRGSIDAFQTIPLSYDEYCAYRKRKISSSQLYSYARDEYLVKDEILFEDVLFLGIDSRYYQGDASQIIQEVISLMKVYNISFPFFDTNKGIIYYQGEESERHPKQFIRF